MSKHITPEFFYTMPSGNKVHPCRLIHKDGTLMWKHALLHNNCAYIPFEEAQEQHIIKTAQRLEELNSWVSQDYEPWECLQPVAWFNPADPVLQTGYSVYFKHQLHDNVLIYDKLLSHIQDHETLELRQNYLYFRRC